MLSELRQRIQTACALRTPGLGQPGLGVTGTFHLKFLELEAVLPTLPAQELSLQTCPNLRLQWPLFSLPILPSLGSSMPLAQYRLLAQKPWEHS